MKMTWPCHKTTAPCQVEVHPKGLPPVEVRGPPPAEAIDLFQEEARLQQPWALGLSLGKAQRLPGAGLWGQLWEGVWEVPCIVQQSLVQLRDFKVNPNN